MFIEMQIIFIPRNGNFSFRGRQVRFDNSKSIILMSQHNFCLLLNWNISLQFLAMGSWYALRKYNLERVKCRLARAYEKTLWRPMFLAVPKSSPYIEEINRGSVSFWTCSNHVLKILIIHCKDHYGFSILDCGTIGSKITNNYPNSVDWTTTTKALQPRDPTLN